MTKRAVPKRKQPRVKNKVTQRTQSPALQFLHERYVGNDPARLAALQQERENLAIAQQVHDLRTSAGLTMRELAERVGTSASSIARIEDADYRGHSLSLLRRIATALHRTVEVRFVPIMGYPASHVKPRTTTN